MDGFFALREVEVKLKEARNELFESLQERLRDEHEKRASSHKEKLLEVRQKLLEDQRRSDQELLEQIETLTAKEDQARTQQLQAARQQVEAKIAQKRKVQQQEKQLQQQQLQIQKQQQQQLLQQQQQQQQLRQQHQELQEQLQKEKQIQLEQQEQLQQQQEQQQLQQRQKEETAAAAAATATAAAAAAAATSVGAIVSDAETGNTDIPATVTRVAPTVSAERIALQQQLAAIWSTKEESVRVFQTEEVLKKLSIEIKKAIYVPVNSIAVGSAEKLHDKLNKLVAFFYSSTILDHPLARDYSLLLMAVRFVSQCETDIANNPQSAFSYASVAISLWNLVPGFGPLLLAHIFQESPFMLPNFGPPAPGQDMPSFRKSRGYHYIEGQLEPEVDYLNRQRGIARFYAALIVTQGRQADGPTHPYGVQHAWRWAANFFLLDPVPDVCATVLFEMLQTLAMEMWTYYGNQFIKLLNYIQRYYVPLLNTGGPKERLEKLLHKYLVEGQIAKPAGMLPPNFW